MYFVFAFWYKPLQKKRFDHYSHEGVMLYHVLANSTIKNNNGKTWLIADRAGVELLHFIDYDKVTIIEDLDNEDHNYFFSALPKFYALKEMGIEDVLVDYDLFLFKREAIDTICNKQGCDMVYSFRETIDISKTEKRFRNNNNKCLRTLGKHQSSLEYTIPKPNSVVSYPNTSLMKFNNEQFKDLVINNYFNHYNILKNDNWKDCLWPDVYIEQYFLQEAARKNGYKISPIIERHDIDSKIGNRYAEEIGFCHLGSKKAELKNQCERYFKNHDIERYNTYIRAYDDFLNKNYEVC